MLARRHPLDPLTANQLPLRAHRVEGLSAASPEAASPTAPTAAPSQNIAPQTRPTAPEPRVRLATRPQRMIRPNPILQIYIVKEVAENLIFMAELLDPNSLGNSRSDSLLSF